MKTIKLHARVQNLQLICSKEELLSLTTQMEGKSFILSVSPTKKRSLNENAYYWALLDILGNELGYMPYEVHDAMKNLFLTDYTHKIPRVRSTSSLSTVEMEEYLQKIRVFALTELNINLPLPNENI